MVALIVSNIAYVVSFLMTIGLGLWVFLKSPKQPTHITFFLMSLAISVFEITHLIGTNLHDSGLSRSVLLFNMTNIFLVCFSLHWVVLTLGIQNKRKAIVALSYLLGLGLCIFYLLDTHRFLLDSSPKLYFPNYYNGGPYYWLMLVFFGVSFFYQIIEILVRAIQSTEKETRSRYFFFFICFLIGYPVGSLAFPLVIGYQIDPMYSSIFGLYTVPLAYAMIRYNLMEVRNAIQKAIAYAILVSVMGFLISAINWGTAYIHTTYPSIPFWVVPLISSILAVFAGGVVWEKIKELDVLKYEFITVVTHKFRTPLTRIKWSLELLKGKQADERSELAVSDIGYAEESLVELTDILVDLTRASQAEYAYSFDRINIAEKVRSLMTLLTPRFADKQITVTLSCPYSEVLVLGDNRRLLFVLHILVENALAYTPNGGQVSVTVGKGSYNGFVAVKDSGIGISKEDMDRVLTRFWRSGNAKKMDTEGMGIGLYMANQILKRHNGTLSIVSDGEGKGSTFTMNVPLA